MLHDRILSIREIGEHNPGKAHYAVQRREIPLEVEKSIVNDNTLNSLIRLPFSGVPPRNSIEDRASIKRLG